LTEDSRVRENAGVDIRCRARILTSAATFNTAAEFCLGILTLLLGAARVRERTWIERTEFSA